MKAKIDPDLINEFKINNIQPIKKYNGGINGVGNVSCYGFIGGRKVKIYTTYRDDLPELRRKLEDVKFHSKVRFPELVATKGRYVIERWIDGPNLTQVPLQKVKSFVPMMKDFLFEFKETSVDFDSSYDHLLCFHGHITKPYKPVAEVWLKEYEKQDSIPNHLRHGDLHEANLVLNNGTLYIVDNDGVSLDNGWFLSWRKSFLYSTRFPQRPFPEMYPTEHLEIEQKYYGNITMKFMELTHFLRQAYFKRDLIGFDKKKVTPQQVAKRYG